MKNRIVTCPFCKRYHMVPYYLNVICSCGAKYYINTREWLDRRTGKIVKGTD